jgi:hypothetical protein
VRRDDEGRVVLDDSPAPEPREREVEVRRLPDGTLGFTIRSDANRAVVLLTRLLSLGLPVEVAQEVAREVIGERLPTRKMSARKSSAWNAWRARPTSVPELEEREP